MHTLKRYVSPRSINQQQTKSVGKNIGGKQNRLKSHRLLSAGEVSMFTATFPNSNRCDPPPPPPPPRPQYVEHSTEGRWRCGNRGNKWGMRYSTNSTDPGAIPCGYPRYCIVAGELCKLARVTGPEFPHPFSPVGRCLPATGRCRAVRYKRQCLPGFCEWAGLV